MSLSTPASIRPAGESDPTSIPYPTASNVAYNFGTSRIIRFTVAAGIIVLGLTAIVLFFKISSYVRYYRRRRRQRKITDVLEKERKASQYEVAAWSGIPGSQGPLDGKRRKKKERDPKFTRRTGGNAYAVDEWEGVAQ